MQKPENKAVKDFIIENTSRDLKFEQEIVETVISWAFKKANEASHNNKEIEISGVGKLLLSQAKLRKQIEKLDRIAPLMKDELRREQIEKISKDLKTKKDA